MRKASAIVDGSPVKSFVSMLSGADQPVRAGDDGRAWDGAIEAACWMTVERMVVVVESDTAIVTDYESVST